MVTASLYFSVIQFWGRITKVRRAQAAMKHAETDVSELADELGVSRSTLYRYVGPEGQLRDRGRAVLGV